jgi:hypothetical protein
MAGGSVHDPVGALLLCSSQLTDYTIVNGRVVVERGEFKPFELAPVTEKHNAFAKALTQAQ